MSSDWLFCTILNLRHTRSNEHIKFHYHLLPFVFGWSSLSCGFCGSGGLGGLDESTWLGGSAWYWVPSWANSGYFLPISSDAIEFSNGNIVFDVP